MHWIEYSVIGIGLVIAVVAYVSSFLFLSHIHHLDFSGSSKQKMTTIKKMVNNSRILAPNLGSTALVKVLGPHHWWMQKQHQRRRTVLPIY
jgi:hypothetical protein